MIGAVIFDVDGTLVDSVDQHAHAWQDAFIEYGHDIAFDKIRIQIGKGGDQLLPVFLDQADNDQIGPRIEARRGEILRERYLDSIGGFPMVRQLLERLIRDGVPIALASSAKGHELQHYKRIAGIEDIATVETSSDDAERSKPHPDIFHAAIDRLGIPPDRIIVVGDTAYDAEAATKAGLRTIGLRCGGFPEQGLRDAGCVAIYDSPADLLANYDTSPITGGAIPPAAAPGSP